MNAEPDFTEERDNRLRQALSEAIRTAVRHEITLFAQAVLPPLTAKLDAVEVRLTTIERSLGLLIDGQALIEKHLAGAFDDDEPWRESLDD